MLQPLVATEFIDMFAGPLSFLPPIEISAARKIRGAFMNLVDPCGKRIAHCMSRASHSRRPYGLGLKADVCCSFDLEIATLPIACEITGKGTRYRSAAYYGPRSGCYSVMIRTVFIVPI
jgi:hypothetical protein